MIIYNNKINRRLLITSFFSLILYKFFNFKSLNFKYEEGYTIKFINLLPINSLTKEILLIKKIKSKKNIESLIDQDYKNKNVIIVDGWILSKIEASVLLNKYTNYVS